MNGPAIKRACVIGWPVGQSLSPLLHGYWLNAYSIAGEYTALAVPPEDFEKTIAALPAKGFAGVSVTIPHKEAAFRLAAARSGEARATGAVNTLIFEAGTMRGLNTDVRGFEASLAESLGANAAKRGAAVVLGAGGAARAIVLALARVGAPEIRILNRTRSRAENVAAAFAGSAHLTVGEWGDWRVAFSGAGLLVNATSLGMTGKPPLEIPLESLPQTAAVADIVYNPLETALLERARAGGRRTMDGLGMLMHQAIPAFAAWFGVTPEVTPGLRGALEEALRARAA